MKEYNTIRRVYAHVGFVVLLTFVLLLAWGAINYFAFQVGSFWHTVQEAQEYQPN